MRQLRQMALAVALASAVTAGIAQQVAGNEAVKRMPDGSIQVETPPIPSTSSLRHTKPCAADKGCHPGPWYMVETSTGLQECTEPFARPTSCRKSTYGEQKLSRLWIAKAGPTWLWCQYPDLRSKCVEIYARPPLNLPYSAVQ